MSIAIPADWGGKGVRLCAERRGEGGQLFFRSPILSHYCKPSYRHALFWTASLVLTLLLPSFLRLRTCPPFPPSSPGRPPSQHRSANTNGPPVFVRPDLQPKSHPLRFLLAGPNLLPCSPALLHFCSPHLSLLPNNPTTSHKQSQAANTHTRSSRVTALRSQLPLRIPTSSQINSSPGSAYLHLIT